MSTASLYWSEPAVTRAAAPRWSRRGPLLALVLLAHGLLLWRLAAYFPQVVEQAPAVLEVFFSAAPEVTPPPPKVQPRPLPRPKTIVKTPPPVIATTAPVAAPSVAQTPAPPRPAETAAPLHETTTRESNREPSLVQPRFDADYLNNPAPDYPRLARELGEVGRVLLRVHVSAQGLPTEVLLHHSCGYERLDRAAQQAVWRWRFVPARLGNEAQAGWVIVPINFSLRS